MSATGEGGRRSPKIDRTGDGQYDFITFNGKSDLGRITEAVVKKQAKGGTLEALPIRLQVGWTREKGEHRGSGLRHIKEEHKDDIEASGLSPEEYVWQFFRKVSYIYEEQPGVFFFRGIGAGGKTMMIRLAREYEKKKKGKEDFYTVHTLYDKKPKTLGRLIWRGRPDAWDQSPCHQPDFGQATTSADSLAESLAAPPLTYGDNPASVAGSPNSARAGLASQISWVDFTLACDDCAREI